MPNLSAIRKRIRTVASTQKITKAMKMVAAARFRRAQEREAQAKPYAETINQLLEDLSTTIPSGVHPLLGGRPVKKRALIVLSSDRGLCGAFNSNLFRFVERELIAMPEVSTALVLVGRKANQYFGKKTVDVLRREPKFWVNFRHETAAALADDLAKQYLENVIDRVDIAYNEFISVISQKPTLIQLLPIATSEKQVVSAPEVDIPYIFEPNREDIVKALVPKAVEVRFFVPCLNSQASEYGARMTAMDSATRNAGEMIDTLTLSMNRARQANITRELMEIISGAEAIK
jgi:F-type H+-transporting ATPase subunit gamma